MGSLGLDVVYVVRVRTQSDIVRGRGVEDKWLADIGREHISEAVDLRLHLWHQPQRHTLLQDAHVSVEVNASTTLGLVVS
jgi:hypothetical protein